MPCYALEDVVPVVHSSAFVHPSAVLIGDVIVEDGCYVGPCACLRGDFGRIVLEQGVNVQDCCVLHGFPGRETRVQRNGHIGHGAIIHSCTLAHDVLVGMNAVVMDDADIGAESIVAACAFVPACMQVPPRSLVAGLPAKIQRELGDEEIAWKWEGTRAYQDLTRRCLASLREVAPLHEWPAERASLQTPSVRALSALKRRGVTP
jgi:phenylacetic acid degradation protein